MMKVSTELGYMKVPKNTLLDLNKIKGLPKNKQVIVTTGSQGEEMSALYRMAFSTHRQVELGAGDKVIISASAIPGNEVTVGRVINELFRKGVNVIYDRADMLHGKQKEVSFRVLRLLLHLYAGAYGVLLLQMADRHLDRCRNCERRSGA